MKNETTQAVIHGVSITQLDSAFYAKANRVTISVSECCDAFTLRKEWGIFIELWEPNGNTVRSRTWLREYKCPKSWFPTKAQAVKALPQVESTLRDYLITKGWLKQD